MWLRADGGGKVCSVALSVVDKSYHPTPPQEAPFILELTKGPATTVML